MAQVYSFDLDKGTDWEIVCVYKDSACNPVNLTGGAFAGKIRQGSSTGAVVGNLSFTITNALAGEFKVSLTNANTSALPDGLLVYDVELTLGGKVYRLFEGQINARAEVTY